MRITLTLPDDLCARLVRIAKIAGTGINHIAVSGIEHEVRELEAYHEVDEEVEVPK